MPTKRIVGPILGALAFIILLLVGLFTVLVSKQQSATVSTPTTALVRQTFSNKITQENLLPGTTNWKSPHFDQYRAIDAEDEAKEMKSRSFADSGGAEMGAQSQTSTIAGYANKTSINHGDSINFFISTTVPSYNINVYRMGWYGGAGGRLITSVTGQTGQNYGVPTPDPVTGMVAANWPSAYTLQTGSDWVSGVYLAYLNGSDGSVSYIIFIVRDDEHPADVLFQIPIATYQAYNAWGGKSLYDYNSPGGRASKVSFDRPYDHDDGAGIFFAGDYNMLRWLERQGYNVSYATSIDLDTNPNLMSNYKVFLTNYHDEYYSKNMRDNITAARDQGKDLAFFTANSVYWQIRFESLNGVADRVIVGYKDPTLDPMSTSSTPWLTTTRWRDQPVNQPENALLGVMYEDVFDQATTYPFVVQNSSHWIYTNLGFQDGYSIPSVIGYEYDKFFNNGLAPANTVVLSNSPIAATSSVSNAAIYTAASGAIVFDAGTMRWSEHLDNINSNLQPDANIELMTINLLSRMISPPPPVTGTPTSTPISTAIRAGTSFYRGINVNGSAVVIDGNNWESGTAPNFSTNGYNFCDPTVPLIPTTDPIRAAMIHCSIYNTTAGLTLSSVPSGTYNVYLYTWEDNWPSTFDISLNGQVVLAGYNSGSAGTWNRLGPWPVTVTNGAISVTTNGGMANLSGIEVWRASSPTSTGTNTATASSTPTITATASKTATATSTVTSTVTSTASNTVTNTATSTLTNSPTATFTPSSTATATLVPSLTATSTTTPTPIMVQTTTFYRAVNINGASLVIDGNKWDSGTSANFSVVGTRSTKQTIPLNPPTDANRAAMIHTFVYSRTAGATLSSVPNGTYNVYLYVWEDITPSIYSIYLNGRLVRSNYYSGFAGTWNKLGPWPVTVTNGTISISTAGGKASISGIEVWSVNSVTATPLPTATPSNTPTSPAPAKGATLAPTFKP